MTHRWAINVGIAVAVLGLAMAMASAEEQRVLTQFTQIVPSTAKPSGMAEGCPPGTFKPLFKAGCARMSADSKLPGRDEEPMRFEVIQLSKSISFLQAIGTITKETPAEFARFMASDAAGTSRDLALHSPGGDVLAGLALGRAIRHARLNTSIGRSIPLEGLMRVYRYKEASCASACAYAFLGGIGRSYPAGAVYALNRDAAALPEPVLQYVAEMGVDPRLLAAEAGPLLEEQSKEWRVVYDGSGLTTFAVEERRGKTVVAFNFVNRDHKYGGVLSCEDGHRAMTLLDLDESIHPVLRVMNQFPVEFEANGRKIAGRASYVGRSELSPGLVQFVLPSLDEKSFGGSGLVLTRVTNPQLSASNRGLLDALSWGDAESAFLFRVSADNGESALGSIFGACH